MADSGDKTSSSGRFLRPHFLNSFYSTIFFLFSTTNFKMSRNMCNLRHKVRNETTFSKQFLLNNHFLFSSTNSKMSRNMCNLRHKMHNDQNLPHESPNFTNYLLQTNFTYNLGHLSTSLTPDFRNSFFPNN